MNALNFGVYIILSKMDEWQPLWLSVTI